MTKEQFYSGKSAVSIEWWLSECDLPALRWARLRAFGDGTADACWDDGGTLYGFDRPDHARNFLLEDEYVRFDRMDEADEREHGLRLAEVAPPTWWTDRRGQSFEYLGTY